QRAVAPGVQKPAIVVLAVDFDRQCAKVAEDAGGDRSAAREAAAAAVALQRAADDQRFAGIERDALLVEYSEGRMMLRQHDLGRNAGAVLARAHERGVG